MKKTKSFLSFLLCCVLTGTLVSCGSSNTNTETTETKSETKIETKAPETQAPETAPIPKKMVEVELYVVNPIGAPVPYQTFHAAYPQNEPITVGKAVKEMLVDTPIEGLDSGAITSLNGYKNNLFSQSDGWLYLVNYHRMNDAGYTLIPPMSSMNDFVLEADADIILYYGRLGEPYASFRIEADGHYSLIGRTAQYNGNNEFSGFVDAPLSGATLVCVNQQTGQISRFDSDEAGRTALDIQYAALPADGIYLFYVEKASDTVVDPSKTTENGQFELVDLTTVETIPNGALTLSAVVSVPSMVTVSKVPG